MAIVLDHTIVPAHDKVASARFFARIFGLEYKGPHSHFAPVQVNEALTLDFDERGDFDMHHYAFKITEPEFDAIFGRVMEEGIPYGSGPRSRTDMEINHRRGRRGEVAPEFGVVVGVQGAHQPVPQREVRRVVAPEEAVVLVVMGDADQGRGRSAPQPAVLVSR